MRWVQEAMSPVPIRPVGASKKIAMLIYGDPGSQKTRFIGSGAQQYKTLIIRPPMDHVDSILGSGAMEAVVRDWEDTWDVRDRLRHEPDLADVVALDSLSLFQDVSLQDAYEAALDRAGPPGSPARKHRESFRADKGEFRVSAERISELIRDLVGMESFHLIVTAHPFWGQRLKTEEDDEGSETDDLMLQPWIQVRGMVSKICGYMNIVGYMEVAERKRGNTVVPYVRMKTEKTQYLYAKNQFYTADGVSVFGENGIMVNPTMPKVMEAINQAAGRTRRRPARRAPRRPQSRRSSR